eukprot:2317728-Amphidinium_carterae.1
MPELSSVQTPPMSVGVHTWQSTAFRSMTEAKSCEVTNLGTKEEVLGKATPAGAHMYINKTVKRDCCLTAWSDAAHVLKVCIPTKSTNKNPNKKEINLMKQS